MRLQRHFVVMCEQACAMVEDLLKSHLEDNMSEHKRMQLRELAALNGKEACATHTYTHTHTRTGDKTAPTDVPKC